MHRSSIYYRLLPNRKKKTPGTVVSFLKIGDMVVVFMVMNLSAEHKCVKAFEERYL